MKKLENGRTEYQELLNALLIKYGIEPDEDWTNNIVWKTLIDSKLDTKQRNLFYNEFTKLELKYKDMTYNSAKVSTHKIDEKLESGRTEYQEFLNSLFIKYGIHSPDLLWSNYEWKAVVDNQINNLDRAKFYKELSAFNISTPSDEIWTHKNNEKLEEIEERIAAAKKAEEEEERIAAAKKAEEEEEERIAAAKKAEEEEERIAAAKKVEEEEERIAAAKKEDKEVEMSDEIQTNDNEEDLLKECPYCAEDIKKKAIKCKHCGESLEEQVTNPIQSNSNTEINSNTESIKSEPTYAPSTTKIVIERPDTATLGIVSLVIGLIGVFFISFILSPIALLFGIFSLMKDDSKVWGILGIIFAIIGAITSPILMGLLSLATYSSY